MIHNPKTDLRSEFGGSDTVEEREWSTREVCLDIGQAKEGTQFSYIQNLETTKEAWDALRVTNEGSKAVKKSHLQMLTSQFEVLQICEEDKFVNFQDKLLEIANKCQALGSPISGERLNWKILRSPPKRFKAKVTAIEESKDIDVMSLDELLGSLQTFEACMKPKAKNKGLALKVVKEASSSDDEEEMALLVKKFMRKGAKPSGKYSREKEVKKSFTPSHERSSHVKSNRKVQCFKCKKLGHYASDCPNGDSKKDKKGKAMAATWSEDDDSNDEESSSDESSSEEELVKCLEDNLKIALREVDEKDDLIKLQVDEFVSTTRRLLGEKNALAKKLREVEGFVLERDRIISSLTLGGSSDLVVEEKLIEASLPISEVIVDKKAPKKRHSKTKNKLKNKVPLETPICASLTPKARPQNVTAELVPRETRELRRFHSAANNRRSNRRIGPDTTGEQRRFHSAV
ncbi:hypothetical protein LWI29_030183 [Acer saccharum]|uniref:CCHC-type domain-containing protein n=1 Tax=Acer saccharum TaxID=4024 RepID=A0AA39S5M0_ACESA|nr:hypothetical protein LWI29_030183 [Acer saccharum]